MIREWLARLRDRARRDRLDRPRGADPFEALISDPA